MNNNHSKFNAPIYLTSCLLLLFFVSCSKSNSNPAPKNTAPTLAITSLSVNTGSFNTSVTITGNGFSSTSANNQVLFNGKAATIASATPTQLTVTVPLGAGTGNVTVSVNNGTPVSGPVFTYQLSVVVSTLVGSNLSGEVNGTGTSAILGGPTSIAVDASGSMYIAGNDPVIRKITPGGVVSSYAGLSNNSANNGTITSFNFTANFGLPPQSVAVDISGNIYVAAATFPNIWKITPTGVVTSFMKNPPYFPQDYEGLASDASGNIYVADSYNNLILKITPDGTVSTFAGSGQIGNANGTGTAASFSGPTGVATDGAGNVYVSDCYNNQIRKITPTGLVSNLGPATFFRPLSLTVDANGNVYVADTGDAVIKKVTPNGNVSIFAGIPGTGGNYQVNGSATSATFYSPTAIAIYNNNNLYVTDGNEVRKIVIE
jgi:sugar lactone lactonase YvrE